MFYYDKKGTFFFFFVLLKMASHKISSSGFSFSTTQAWGAASPENALCRDGCPWLEVLFVPLKPLWRASNFPPEAAAPRSIRSCRPSGLHGQGHPDRYVVRGLSESPCLRRSQQSAAHSEAQLSDNRTQPRKSIRQIFPEIGRLWQTDRFLGTGPHD